MSQVLSNTKVITDWFLTAIKSYPLAACPVNSAAHALLQKFSPSTYTAHKFCILYEEKKKKKNLLIYSLQLEELYKEVGSGKGPLLLSSVPDPGLKLQDKLKKYCLYLSNCIKHTYCHLPCH